MSIRCSLSHQGFTLLSRSSFIFAVLLIILYSSSFWFTYNASNLGIPAILISFVITHYFLVVLESKTTSKLLSFIWKGKPVTVYRNWLTIEENALVFGLYRLMWNAIDSVSLGRSGNLIFKSRALSGPANIAKKRDLNPPMTVLKVPFSALDLNAQKSFIALLKEKSPKAELGQSLIALVDKKNIISPQYIHLFTLIVFVAILMDVGYSTFSYVELLKRYYLSHKTALAGSIAESQKLFDSAEYLQTHLPKYSMISPKLFYSKSTIASINESRSKVLWDLGKKQDALFAQAQAAKLNPKSFKINLRLARLYTALGQSSNAQQTVEELIEKHKHALLPRLYEASLFLKNNKQEKANSTLVNYLTFLNDDYFTPPPVWPPVGEDAIHELFYQEDLEFLLSSLISPSQKH